MEYLDKKHCENCESFIGYQIGGLWCRKSDASKLPTTISSNNVEYCPQYAQKKYKQLTLFDL